MRGGALAVPADADNGVRGGFLNLPDDFAATAGSALVCGGCGEGGFDDRALGLSIAGCFDAVGFGFTSKGALVDDGGEAIS